MEEKKRSNLILWLLIGILLVALIWTVYDKISIQKDCQATIETLEKTAADKDSLQLELEQIYMQYDQLKTNNDTLNYKLSKEKEKVAKLLEEIRRVKASDKAKVKQLKDEVETLRKIMKSYIRQIDSLYQKNQILMQENKQIKQQYNVVLTEKEQLKEVKDSLQQTVKIAQELEARQVTFEALNRRNKPTSRIKKTNKFEVCFTILANKVAQKGTKTIYLRIAKPDGEILINEHSGTFIYEGKEIYYSAAREVEYNGQDTPVCLYYLNETELPKGKYTAFVFADGKIIFDKEITLK